MKIIEHANKIAPGGPPPTQDGTSTTFLLHNLSAVYGIMNLHLSLSIGSLGIVWGTLNEAQSSKGPIFFVSIAIITLALAGAISRGIVSKGAPTAMKWSDWDWRFGVSVPNGLGFAALLLSTGYQLMR
jgi:hypothetical protein